MYVTVLYLEKTFVSSIFVPKYKIVTKVQQERHPVRHLYYQYRNINVYA